MEKAFIVASLLLMSCGGSLSDEQRKKLHEGMVQQKIVKLSDSEIVTAAMDRGRTVYEVIEKLKFDSAKIDSVARVHEVKIGLIRPGSPNAKEIENQLIEAYVMRLETGSTQENIQKLRISPKTEDYDSLLYSRPILKPMADGAFNVEGVWSIYLSKKNVIISISKE
jgi:hypothetical protein